MEGKSIISLQLPLSCYPLLLDIGFRLLYIRDS